jgi:Xaa-Pro aminopeptidase
MPPSVIEKIRNLMSVRGLAAYIIPTQDPHQSEYTPDCWRRRAFVSGFKGSAGDLILTSDNSCLWTDSRYYLQAEQQLKASEIRLFKSGMQGVPSQTDWLLSALKKGDVVGIDPKLFSRNAYAKLSQALTAGGIVIRSIEENLVDMIWDDRPLTPLFSAVPHPEIFSGESLSDRLTRIRFEMGKITADVLLVTTLDALAWTFNIRGSDVPYNPVVIGYGAVERDKAFLFVDRRKTDKPLLDHLGDMVEIRDYDSFEAYLCGLAQTTRAVAVDPETVSRWAVERLQGTCSLVFKRSIAVSLKAQKNEIELSGITAAHIRDGAAVVQFLSWLSKEVFSGKVTEISAANRLEAFRKENERYKGPSFGTISAFGEHGAVVHYEASPETDSAICPGNLYLVDSGGQYLDGTTDITRTVAIGSPTAEQKDRFTRVLKGHLNLAAQSFPSGTCGSQLDVIARAPLWDVGLNFGHGTGHGVGCYLSVHEGPHAISYYRGMDVPLAEGMVLSDEPGYYKENEWGIRIENLVKVVRNDDLSKNGAEFFRFEILTLCPIDISLIEPMLLLDDEIDFLNAYHLRVRTTLSPLLDADTKEWLLRATQEVLR